MGRLWGMEVTSLPVSDLHHYHRNARVGNVARIRNSLRANGQFKPIVVNLGTKTGRPMEVLAGNHVLKAAREEGWEQVSAVQVDLDDRRAAAVVLADNKASDDSTYDLEALDAILSEYMEAEDADVDDLAATGFSEIDYLDAIGRLEDDDAGDEDPGTEPGSAPVDEPDSPGTQGLGNPVISTTIVFDTEHQRRRWTAFVRYLRENYDGETIAERLTVFIDERVE